MAVPALLPARGDPTRKFDRKSQVFCLEIPGRLGYRAKPTSMERFTWDSVQRRPGPCGSTWDFESNVADRPGWDPQPLCSCRFARQQSPPARNKLWSGRVLIHSRPSACPIATAA